MSGDQFSAYRTTQNQTTKQVAASLLVRCGVHEMAGGDAVLGFAVMCLAGTAEAPVLWAGDRLDLYPPGLAWCALDPARLILAEAPDDVERLAALEIALRGGMHGVAMVGAVPRLAARRLALAARHGGGVGLVLRRPGVMEAAAFTTRWRIGAAPSGAAGTPRWRAELLYARGRPPCVFLAEVDRHAAPPALVMVPEFHEISRSEDGWRRAG